MDAFFIINVKTKECLITKEFKESQNTSKLSLFIQELDKILNNQKSPYTIVQNTIFVYINESDIMYISLLSEDSLILSTYRILENIKESIKQSLLVVNTDNIRDNFINITLMIDQYLLKGIPIFNEIPVLSSLICPNSLTNKITEKFVGKVKEYDTRTLNNYMKDLQINDEGFKYSNETAFAAYEILFDFYDFIECTVDRNFQIQTKMISSEIIVKSNYVANVDCTLLLNVPFDYLDFTLDSSVKTSKKEFKISKNLELTTRHGSYSLINFIPLINNVYLPFKVITSSQQVNNQANITITIEPISVKETYYDLLDFSIQLYFPDFYENSNLSANNGEFEFDSKKFNEKVGKWSIPKIDKTLGAAILKGNLVIDQSKLNDKKIVLSLSGYVDKYSISGGKVEKLFIKKDPANLKFFKGTKSITHIKCLELII